MDRITHRIIHESMKANLIKINVLPVFCLHIYICLTVFWTHTSMSFSWEATGGWSKVQMEGHGLRHKAAAAREERVPKRKAGALHYCHCLNCTDLHHGPWAGVHRLTLVYGGGGGHQQAWWSPPYIQTSSHPQPVPVRPSKDAGKVFADMERNPEDICQK